MKLSKKLQEYQKLTKKEVHFLDINKPFVEKFTNWLINIQKYSINYAGKQIDNLKTVCLDAEKLNIPVNPYIKQIEGFTESNEDRFIVTLSKSEIEQIRNATITSEALNNARSLLLIGCEIGQRASDLLNITKTDFRYLGDNLLLDLTQQKTGTSVTVPIGDPMTIDLIKTNFPYKISSQKLNEYIKKVCEAAEICERIQGRKLNPKTRRKKLGIYPKHELITSHSFRRSFATNYYKRIPTPILINITGAFERKSIFDIYQQTRR